MPGPTFRLYGARAGAARRRTRLPAGDPKPPGRSPSPGPDPLGRRGDRPAHQQAAGATRSHNARVTSEAAPRTVHRTAPPGALGRLRVPAGMLVAAGAAVSYVGVVDPHVPGHYPVCPLRYGTGVWCPGCGGLRSVHSLVHGDVPAALGANALVAVGCAAFAVLWVVWAVRAMQGRSLTWRGGPAAGGSPGRSSWSSASSGTCPSVAGYTLDQLLNVQLMRGGATGCEVWSVLRIPSQ